MTKQLNANVTGGLVLVENLLWHVAASSFVETRFVQRRSYYNFHCFALSDVARKIIQTHGAQNNSNYGAQ